MSGSSHVVERIGVDVLKLYTQMPTWDTVNSEPVSARVQKNSLSYGERQRVAGRPAEAVSHRASYSGSPVEYPRLRSRRRAKLGLEDNTA